MIFPVYLIRILTGQSDPLMQVDREEHHQFVLAMPYNLHGTTVYVCHGISSGAWGLGWATPWLDTVIINIFHIIIKVFVNCYLLQVGDHILTWSSFCFFATANFCGPHSQVTAPPLWNVQNLGSLLFSGFFCCPTPLTTPHLIFNLWQQLAPLLVDLQLDAQLVGASWD